MKRTKTEITSLVDKPMAKSRIVAKNTIEIHYEDGTKAIRLHDTDVVTFHPDKIVFDSGGWRTPTTKDRMTTFSPFRISQDKGIWYIKGYFFYDGIEMGYDGNLLSENKKPDYKYIKKTKRKINKFVRLITEDNLPVPNNGDCWFCLMKTEDGETLGDIGNNHDHLWSHIEEGYLPGSLLVNAMREKGYNDMQIAAHYQMKIADTFRRAVRKYLHKRLLQNVQTR